MRPAPATPLWIKLSVAAVLLVGAAWWMTGRADRLGNEHRLAAVASQIAGRAVRVRCPGPIGRVLGAEGVEGSVRFSASGRPANDTKLSQSSCAELDALAEGRRRKELACTARAGILCGAHGTELAIAVDTVTHESFHMSGIRDEARTECSSLQTMAATAVALGASPAQGSALARAQYLETYPQMPEPYRSRQCADGGDMDLRPADGRFP